MAIVTDASITARGNTDLVYLQKINKKSIIYDYLVNIPSTFSSIGSRKKNTTRIVDSNAYVKQEDKIHDGSMVVSDKNIDPNTKYIAIDIAEFLCDLCR